MQIDLDTLFAEARADQFASGKRRYYDNRVKKITTAKVGDEFNIYSTVSAVGGGEYSCKITFDGQGGLYDYSCSCADFSIESGPCRHIVATAL
ncbi:MAG: SWIM zinc finger family protein, partial [Clostridia bacterium]|nr:SWIM zinc finger family protein [Clostridia bacterium]